MNPSKKHDPRQWRRWRRHGAVTTVHGRVKAKTPHNTSMGSIDFQVLGARLQGHSGVTMPHPRVIRCSGREALEYVFATLWGEGYEIDPADDDLFSASASPTTHWVADSAGMRAVRCDSCHNLIPPYGLATDMRKCERCSAHTKGNHSEVYIHRGIRYTYGDPLFPVEPWYDIFLVSA